MAGRREVLAALDGESSLPGRVPGGFDVFHLHFFVDGSTGPGASEVLHAPSFANAVGGPLSYGAKSGGRCEYFIREGFSSLSLFFFFFSVNSSQEARERKQKRSQEEPRETRRWQPARGLSSPSWSLRARENAARPPGPGGLPGSASRQRPCGGLQREVTVGRWSHMPFFEPGIR